MFSLFDDRTWNPGVGNTGGSGKFTFILTISMGGDTYVPPILSGITYMPILAWVRQLCAMFQRDVYMQSSTPRTVLNTTPYIVRNISPIFDAILQIPLELQNPADSRKDPVKFHKQISLVPIPTASLHTIQHSAGPPPPPLTPSGSAPQVQRSGDHDGPMTRSMRRLQDLSLE